eukprot:TRINITY_DN11199_c0_g1_i1.p1 TRINITY_DN11199_c0_g1~~TRINITY_DN11199_c0_g1_i1.p1  ORF type:complete len:243 (+),score=72.76 TRINITY_DN11199_c0_g1_i1:204-932(+)
MSNKGDMLEDDEETLLGELNVSSVSRRVWLVKLPDFLANEWESKGPDQELGKVKVIGGNQITIISNGNSENSIRDYTLQLEEPAADNPVFVFSETQDGVLNMEGTVERKGLAKPSEKDPGYRAYCKERVRLANAKTRTVSQLSTAQPSKQQKVQSIFAESKKKEPGPARRAEERLKQEELIKEIFRAFEKTDYLPLKSIQQVTNQPVQWLKQVLETVCIYNKTGDHKRMYELKPEYKVKRKS